MSKSELHGWERRTAKRYRVPGRARVFFDGDGSPVTLTDISAGGCLLQGERLPAVGTRVFLSLDIGGLPNVRLPAVTVRSDAEVAAVRFEVPATSVGGLDQLLAQYTSSETAELNVLVVDADTRSRTQVTTALRSMGAQVIAVEDALGALRGMRADNTNVVLARADVEGLAALSMLSRERPSAFRVAYGRRTAIDQALAIGIAQAAADDPCSAKALSELLRKGRLRASS
ncbi:MAG TPA: PilZ domain-containing protein [Polyangiales bacterium]|nr:PilZ domain-containing protein [Polyangiales bacterium]